LQALPITGSPVITSDPLYKAPAARATSLALNSTVHATMIHESTPYRVLKISELISLIASQLALVSRKSTVNLACACRSLEEPVLSILWETQSLLFILLKVLPEETWDLRYWTFSKSTVCGPDPPSEGLKA